MSRQRNLPRITAENFPFFAVYNSGRREVEEMHAFNFPPQVLPSNSHHNSKEKERK
jgi:hypothetical protein